MTNGCHRYRLKARVPSHFIGPEPTNERSRLGGPKISGIRTKSATPKYRVSCAANCPAEGAATPRGPVTGVVAIIRSPSAAAQHATGAEPMRSKADHAAGATPERRAT